MGVVALAVGLYLLSANRKNKVSMVVDIEVQQKLIDGKVWPQPKRIIDCTADPKEQKE